MCKKTIAIACCLVLAAFFLTGCASEKSGADQSKVQVSVSFNAIGELARAVGGDRISVSTIIPDGTKPHDFEPKAGDLVSLNTAQVFIYNGLGMEAWAEQAVSAAKNTGLVVLDASRDVDAIKTDEGAVDPHIWLSLKCAETMAASIRDALIDADPEGRTVYENNCAAFISELERVYQSYTGNFAALHKKSFVTGHAAFAYLCRDFGLTQHSVENVFAEGEPSAKQLAELIDYCKTNGVTTIFSEELASAELAQTLADASSAKVETIFTLESTENGKSYLDRMTENLEVIYESLK